MIIADTNYLVRLFTKTPPSLAKQALKDLETNEPGSIYLRDYVVSETMYVLEYHDELAFSRESITEGMRLILSHPAWNCDDELHSEALGIFSKHKLDYADCFVAAEYRLRRAKSVLTFDKQLRKHIDKT